MTDKEIVLIGIGEIGGVLAKGFLRLGSTLHPVTRNTNMAQLALRVSDPALVVVAVAEVDLSPLLEKLPETWRSRLCLLQNELLPGDWSDIPDPTVISIWFEKKPGMDAKVIIPSPLFGPQADLLAQALEAVNIPTTIVADSDELLFQLVVKNLYILTSNIAGLQTGGTVSELWRNHRAFAESIAREVIQLQQALTGRSFDADALIHTMLTAFQGDPDHKCMGRSAPARLQRTLVHADRLGLELPQLRKLEQTMAVS